MKKKMKKKMNVNIVIDGIFTTTKSEFAKDAVMFEEMINELRYVMYRNSLLSNIGVSWKRGGRT
jgi:hypothetical protein